MCIIVIKIGVSHRQWVETSNDTVLGFENDIVVKERRDTCDLYIYRTYIIDKR